MIIENAKIQPIIGIETNSYDGKTIYVLDLHIEAKNINPEDFKKFKGKMDLKIEILHPIIDDYYENL